MGQYNQFEDLIELVEHEPGWRVIAASGSGAFRIMPADKDQAVIHVTRCTGGEPLENIKCKLRRAGFKPLIRENSKPMKEPATTPGKLNGNGHAQLQPQALAPAAPRDVIAEARAHVSVALDALAGLDRLLGEIGAQQESLTKMKELLQQVLK